MVLITYHHIHQASHHYVEEVVTVDWFLMLIVRKIPLEG